MISRYISSIIHKGLAYETDNHILTILASLNLIKILFILSSSSQVLLQKKYVCYLLDKRETGYQFIMVPSNFTRNCVNFSLFVYKRICGICTHRVERCGPITGLGAVLSATECTAIIFITEICHRYKIQRRF